MKLRHALLAAACAAPSSFVPPALADDPRELPPVVVTATRSEQDAVRLPASVRVITAAEILASGARHLVDVLRDAGSLQLTDFYGDGSRAQVDARAFGDAANANTLVLVDGRRLNNPDIATPDLNSIALGDIERIEIIEGSAGALYGDQATGGVINIVTKQARRGGVTSEISGGSFGAAGVRTAVDAVGEGAVGRLSAEYRAADNYRDHNRLEYRNFLGRGGPRWNGGEAFVELGRVEEDLQTPGTLFAREMAQDRRQSSANFANDFSDTITRLQRLGVSQALGDWRMVLEQTSRRSHGVFRLSSVFGAALADASQRRDLRSLNPRLVGSAPLFGRAAELTLGGDFQRAEYQLDSPFGTQRNEQRQSDAYAQAIVPLPALIDVTLGARAGHLSNVVSDGFIFTQPTAFADDEAAAQLGLSWRPVDALRLYARADRNYRYPKVDEFTFTSAAFGQNENLLQTQQGETWEAGADWSGGGLALAGTLFRLDTDQEIAFDPAANSGFGANLNFPASRRDGAQLRGRWQALPWLALAASGQYVDAQVTGGSQAGRDIPMAASKTGQASATFALPATLGAQLGVRYTGERALAGDFDNTLPRLPSHAVVHLALAWDWRALSFAARVDNLLDREYAEYGANSFDPGMGFAEAAAYLPSPERSFSLSARCAF